MNRDEAAEQIRLWALAEVKGLNALLADFNPPPDGPASLPLELQRLGRALRQGAHVLSHQEGWNGQEQLASQLLARLADDGALESLRVQAAEWLRGAGGATPRSASLLAQEALLRTLPVGSDVTALLELPDGRQACGCRDGTIRLWDLASGSCTAVFEGHQGGVRSLAVLGDGRLASGSNDRTIRLWDPRRPDGAPRVLFVADAAIRALAWIPNHQLLVAGDASGRLHWLELGAISPERRRARGYPSAPRHGSLRGLPFTGQVGFLKSLNSGRGLMHAKRCASR